MEAVRFFNLLIESEEGDFVADGAFADRLISFIEKASTILNVNPDNEAELVELMFGVAAKLRQRHEILECWFRPTHYTEGTDNHESSDFSAPGPTDFPLMYLLLEYIRHEGRAGDFARTGLLYIAEMATCSELLEKWIIESEFATMMASGLGALYSQLSRCVLTPATCHPNLADCNSKLVLSYSKDSLPPILEFSDMTQPLPPVDAELTDSPAFQAHLGTFRSYLIFWQDVQERCYSQDLKQTLLDHFDLLFLRPVL